MPKRVEPLAPSVITNAKPQAKPYVLRDGRGLLLLIDPSGSKLWRLDYRRPGTGKRNMLSLGTYPYISLRKARERRDEARKLLADGVDPGRQRKADTARAASTFGGVAAEWLDKQRANLAAVTCAKVEWQLSLAEPLKDRPIADIAAPEVLEVLRKIEARGTIETAHRVKQRIGTVLRYAVATGRAQRDCTLDLRGSLAPVTSTPRAAITDPAKVADLLRSIDGYTGQPVTHAARCHHRPCQGRRPVAQHRRLHRPAGHARRVETRAAGVCAPRQPARDGMGGT